jgi:DNA (cytosine-5)-methyltransferase 1
VRYGSVCSGIEAATVAWHGLGWEPAFFSEIEAFPKAVLAHRWPGVPDLGDFTTIGADRGPVDVLVGGTPCQSFSVAGLRKGMADARGNLALEFLRLAARLDARWVLWENVPGVLSSNGGRDFGAFLGGLAELGYGFAYRVLDAQFFGVAQRRRRVFVVGHAGGLWQRAAAVLFERASLRGDPPPRRAKGEGAPRSPAIGVGVGGDISHTLKAEGFDASEDGTGRGVPVISAAVCAKWAKGTGGPAGDECQNLIPILEVGGGTSSRGSGPNGAGIGRPGDPMFTLQAGKQHAVCEVLAWDGVQITSPETRLRVEPGRPSPTLNQAGQITVAIPSPMAVRRLTPRECERLQGFPDDYTAIPGAKDGPRYRALGNSMAVPVMRWLGERIALVDAAVRSHESEAA